MKTISNLFINVASIILFSVAVPCFADTTIGNVLVLGDSISAGLGVKPERAWVQLFKREMQEKYRLQVINASVSGETSGGGKMRLNGLLKAHQPRLVIIELGGNDGLRGLSTKTLESNLTEMVAQSHRSGAKVLLIGMRIPSSYGARYGNEFAAVYPAVASANHIPLLPFLLDKIALDPGLMQEDKIHPNDKAQPQLLRNVMAVLEPYLKHQVGKKITTKKGR